MSVFEQTFEHAALEYEKSRPAYVNEIYEDMFRYKSVGRDSYVLEIGLGTGKASRPVLDTQCHFVGIEPGERLADLAQKKYGDYKNFDLFLGAFQDFMGDDRRDSEGLFQIYESEGNS